MTAAAARRLAVLGCLTAVVGCGGGNGDPDEPRPGPPRPPAVTVSMKALKYVPAHITVKAGQTVAWTNDDDVPHNVVKESGAGPDFSSGTIEPDGAYSRRFTTRGRIAYLCTIHPTQTGSVTVR